MNHVLRNDGRVCYVIPSGTSWEMVHDVFPDGEPVKVRPFDDVVEYMEWYAPGGAVATRCGQLALYNKRCDAQTTCLDCLAHT